MSKKMLDFGNGILIDVEAQLRLLDIADCEESLYYFLKKAWPHFESSPFQGGWALEAICDHLQAVTDGEIKRLCINIPPRTGKTSIISAAWPAWTWAQSQLSHTSGNGVEFMTCSYGLKLAAEGSDKCRKIIKSEWYQELFGDRVKIREDKDATQHFGLETHGQRIIRSVGAPVTGFGANVIIIDDGNAAQDAQSELDRQSVLAWYQGALISRLNDPKLGAIVNVQQRIAEDDLTGFILDNDTDNEWTHLCLPMLYEKDRHCVTRIGWEDPRKVEGELLWPDRFGLKEVKTLERAMGSTTAAGQLQQRPEPAGGGIIKSEWWQPWDAPQYMPFDYIVASLDSAYTTKTQNDPSALTVWGIFSEDIVGHPLRQLDKYGKPEYLDRGPRLHAPKVMLMYAWAERLEFHTLIEKVVETCKRFKVDKLLVESKASGLSVAQEIRRLYSHQLFSVQTINPGNLDKMARLFSVQHIFSEGMVYAPDKTWAQMVINQMGTFPKGKHDDLVDSSSMAIKHLRDMSMLMMSEERGAEIEESMVLETSDSRVPLYPV